MLRENQEQYSPSRRAIATMKYADENQVVEGLLKSAPMDKTMQDRALESAKTIISKARSAKDEQGTLDAFLQEFGLSNEEGVALMCLAESLLRVPDADTADRLIAEKISSGKWASHKGQSRSLFVNASTWALMMTGGVLKLDRKTVKDPGDLVGRLVHRAGEPVIRKALQTAMRIMGGQFVLGRTIDEALKRAGGYLTSFDMLGEGARTDEQAEIYFKAYETAIDRIGQEGKGKAPEHRHAISVKLSALFARYEEAQSARVLDTLYERLLKLAVQARGHDINFTVDAEEADRLDISLDLIDRIVKEPALQGWTGFGLAVQAYQKRAPQVIDHLIELAKSSGQRLMIRLVKGAYWDSEIKLAQEENALDYPVFTRKAGTDVCYTHCAAKMLDAGDLIYPQFATHNAMTIASILEMAGSRQGFEFQRLHGMGELLYKVASEAAGRDLPVRVYGPCGSHEDLLPYLVRRLLENGANSSFVNRFLDDAVSVDEVAMNPFALMEAAQPKRHDKIPLPRDIYGDSRVNSKGVDLTDRAELARLEQAVEGSKGQTFHGGPIVNGQAVKAMSRDVFSPADLSDKVGTTADATPAHIEEAHERAREAQGDWDARGGVARGAILRKAADLLEAREEAFTALISREAGRVFPDIIAEIREAVDFLRYYAAQAEEKFAEPIALPGPTGEDNHLSLHGRGVFVCISPWNFPLAIFIGQVAAALAAGNSVLAKPAEQTPIIGHAAVQLLHDAGIPGDVLHFLPGDGKVGAQLVALPHLGGVAFTGSTDVAKLINRTLAEKDGPITPLIAETGGQNAMIVDSTALAEQVTDDVIRSGFLSAGQRCSCLRVLLLQEDIADKQIEMIKGAMQLLKLGAPGLASTDIGPIINEDARSRLDTHLTRMEKDAKVVARAPLDEGLNGWFFAPALVEIDDWSVLHGEVFGPVVHVKRYKASELKQEMAKLRDQGFGLTFGLHSRIEGLAEELAASCGCGNVYVNRNMVGAVVGVQPFGGHGLSGTGPKAGGPHYLLRMAVERTTTINTTATGGNAALLQL